MGTMQSKASRATRLGASRNEELKGFADVKVFSMEMMTSICRQAGLKDPRLVKLAFDQIEGRVMTDEEVAAMTEADLDRSQAEDVVGIGRVRVAYADRATTRWKLLLTPAPDSPEQPAQPDSPAQEDPPAVQDVWGCSKCRHSARGCRACNPGFIPLRAHR